MCKKAVFSLLLTFAVAHAGIVSLNHLDYLEGPSTKTKVIGPDGSIIDAYLPGGRIDLRGLNAPLIQTVPAVIASPAIQRYDSQSLALRYEQIAAQEPIVNTVDIDSGSTQRAAGSLTEIGSVTPQPHATIEYSPNQEPKVLLHPGTPPRIETRESVPVTELNEENTETTEFTTTEATTVSPSEGSSYFSGRYVPDNFEALYDDGSYRAEHY